MIDLDDTPEVGSTTGRVRAVLTVIAGTAMVTLLVLAGGLNVRDDPVAARSPSPARASPTPAPTRTVDLVTSVARDLRFIPLLPAPVPTGASVKSEGCGIATTPCLEIRWSPSSATRDVVSILEGPAGCCLDGVRGDGRRNGDTELRSGLFGHWEDLDGRFGGPILWWVDTGVDSAVYVAVTGPVGGDRNMIVRLARSLVPLSSSP